MKWMLDRIGRLIAAYSQKPASGYEPITPADPHQTDLVPSSEPRRSSERIGSNFDALNRHATKHFHATGHPVIEGYDPPEGWGWCYVDEVMLDLSDRMTPHNGPIPRFV